MEAVRYLQRRYGFLVRDYNFQSMLAYRTIAKCAVETALLACGCITRYRSCCSHTPPRCDDIIQSCASLWFNLYIEDGDHSAHV
jgi:hypothetical protein